MKRVLTIDGGGIKGIIPAQILYNIENCLKVIYKKDIKIGEYFDIIVGTSTGGILTVMYLSSDDNNKPLYSAKDIVDFYFDNANNIFNNNIFHKLKTCFNLFGPKYTHKGLTKVTDNVFKNKTLGELLKPCIITSYDTMNNNIMLFKQHKSYMKDFLLKDIVYATCAAPTYFRPKKLNNYCLIDGGMYSSNPSMMGYTEARKLFENEEIKVLSIGTGIYDNPLSYNKLKKYGILKWIIPLIDILLKSNNKVTDYYMDKIIFNNHNYLRINDYICKENSKIDNVKYNNLLELKNIGDDIFKKYKHEIFNFLK